MPTLREVLDLMQRHPDKKILLDRKGNRHKTAQVFLQIISDYPPEVRQRVLFPYDDDTAQQLRDLSVHDFIDQGGKSIKTCMKRYFFMGWTGYFPRACRGIKIFIPTREKMYRFLGSWGENIHVIDLIWGWPGRFINLAHRYGTQVYASQVDSAQQYEQLADFPLDGLMTNKIELIGPLVREKKAPAL